MTGEKKLKAEQKFTDEEKFKVTEKIIEDFFNPELVSYIAKNSKILPCLAGSWLKIVGESHLDQISALSKIPPESIIEARNELVARSNEKGSK
ncbi:MAG: hypothetical protein LBT59_15380 [Clostridiales bacterium]|jgi:hypothetical protein|nr:hypothetical protein [Clostridiales bacterium]